MKKPIKKMNKTRVQQLPKHKELSNTGSMKRTVGGIQIFTLPNGAIDNSIIKQAKP